MTIFVDASALTAIILGEPEANQLADLMEADRTRLVSAIAVWETVAGLCRSYTFSVPAARTHVGRFLEQYHHEWRQPGDKIARQNNELERFQRRFPIPVKLKTL